MSQSPRCPVCNTELPIGTPPGMCPGCLLKAGLESQPAASGDPGPTAASPSVGFVPPAVAAIAAKFPQLEILELLGKGGMGAVYKARQKALDRLVAVKILPPEVGHDPAFAERFMREARALARLSHPNIVAVYDFGQQAGLYYFAMEYVDGVNLRQAMNAEAVPASQALTIVGQICDALQYAHDEGIVHRDIKPENILLDKKGRIKIADFGLSKLLSEQQHEMALTGTHQVMGTLRYMAPEQMEGLKQVDHRADIYSLGVVFYELLTGEVPLGRFEPPSHKAQVDARLDDVVLRSLAREPDKRYQQASQVRTDVETIRNLPGAVSTSPGIPAGMGTKNGTALPGPPRLLLTIAAALVGIVACAWPIQWIERGFWGVNRSSSSSFAGVTISDILPGSPAAKAGVKDGDQLMTINGQKVDFYDIARIWKSIDVGAQAELEVERKLPGPEVYPPPKEKLKLTVARAPDPIGGRMFMEWQLIYGIAFFVGAGLVVVTWPLGAALLWRGGLLTLGFAALLVCLFVLRWSLWMVIWQRISLSDAADIFEFGWQKWTTAAAALALVGVGLAEIYEALGNIQRDGLRRGKQMPTSAAVAVSVTASDDAIGRACAILAIVFLALGLLLPAVLAGLLGTVYHAAVAVSFLGCLTLAVVFGVLGRRHKPGRIAAWLALATAFGAVAFQFLSHS